MTRKKATPVKKLVPAAKETEKVKYHPGSPIPANKPLPPEYEPAKEPVKEVKKPAPAVKYHPGTKIPLTEKLPEVIHYKHGSPVSSHSKLLVLTTDDGKTHHGYMQQWNNDVNSLHIKAKKGDSFFYNTDDVILTNVVAWKVK